VRILVVDDDPGVRDSLRRSLIFNGYEIELADDGQRALNSIALRRPDAVVLDVMMPGLDGLETCRRLRAAGEDLPVLMLTAREALADRVEGLDAGADDYLVKPFALEELLARLRALLRRSSAGNEPGQQLRFSDLTLDLGTREVWRGTLRFPLPARSSIYSNCSCGTRDKCSSATRSSKRYGVMTFRPPPTHSRSTSATCDASSKATVNAG